MKQIFSLLAVFVILVGAYLVVREYAEPKSFQPPEELSLEAWQTDNFVGFQLEDEEQKTALKKENRVWSVNGFNVDQSRLNSLLSALSSSKVVSRVSSNPENHDRFEVGETGTTFTVQFVEGEDEQYVIGKNAGANSVYLRIPDRDDVYVLDGPTISLFNPELSIWRERKVTQFAQGEIESVQFSNAFNTYSVAKSDDSWTLQRPGWAARDVEAEKVFPWLGKVINLQAGDFPTTEMVQELLGTAGLATITLQRDGAEDQSNQEVLTVYLADRENFYLVIREQDQSGFYVSSNVIDETFPFYNDLVTELTSTE